MRMSEDLTVIWDTKLVSHTRLWNRYSIAGTKNHFPIFSSPINHPNLLLSEGAVRERDLFWSPERANVFPGSGKMKNKNEVFSTDVPNNLPKAKARLSPAARKTIRFARLFEPFGSKFFLLGLSPIESKMRLCLTHLVGELDAHQFGAWRHLTFLPSALSWLSLFFLIIVFSFVFLKIMFFVFPHYCL